MTRHSAPKKPKRSAREKRRLRLMRRGHSQAITKHGIGGLEKSINKPKPITLPKLKLPVER